MTYYIVCALTGLILNDIQLGLLAGGLTPVRGTQPQNPVLEGVIAVVFAYTPCLIIEFLVASFALFNNLLRIALVGLPWLLLFSILIIIMKKD